MVRGRLHHPGVLPDPGFSIRPVTGRMAGVRWCLCTNSSPDYSDCGCEVDAELLPTQDAPQVEGLEVASGTTALPGSTQQHRPKVLLQREVSQVPTKMLWEEVRLGQ